MSATVTSRAAERGLIALLVGAIAWLYDRLSSGGNQKRSSAAS